MYPPALLAQMFQPYFNGVFPPPEVAFHFLSQQQQSTSGQAQPTALDVATAAFTKRMALIQHPTEDRDSGNETLSYAGSPPLSGTSSNESSRSNSFSVSALLKTELVHKAKPVLSPTQEETKPLMSPAGFFRRTVQKNMEYTCHKEKTCPVDRESVRQDRTRKRKTRDDDKDVELDETRMMMRIVEEVTQAYREAFGEGLVVQNPEDMLQRIGHFVSKISLFKEYSEDAFAAKIRQGAKGCMLLRSAFSGDDSPVTSAASPALVERLRSGLGHVGLEELALLSAVHIAQPDGVHGSDHVSLKLTECLQAQVRLNNPEKENSSKFTRMLFKLPLLDAS
ncbi:zinc finger, C4 type [Teladorsagia circumcincta]|uniref:Zinc finger, C4 type n=1 Tax=Teladorsagia circumcincta TaxID=45464 RepID=A0A2G9UDN2_TELCI|nr:zinc finger, C4 type [Teladorsagia circumcincta]